MTKYELIFKEVQKRYASGEYTLEQAEEINTVAYEKYMEKTPTVLKATNFVAKKANDEFIEMLRECSKEYKAKMKEVKKLKRQGNKSEALTKLKELKKSLEDFRKVVEKTPPSLAGSSLSVAGNIIDSAFKGAALAEFAAVLLVIVALIKKFSPEKPAKKDIKKITQNKKYDPIDGKFMEVNESSNDDLNTIEVMSYSDIGAILGITFASSILVMRKIKYGTVNQFKETTLKAIDENIKSCDKAIKKLESVK